VKGRHIRHVRRDAGRRTVGQVGFPTSPDPAWSPVTRDRWDTARGIADAMTAAGGVVDRYGWHLEREPIPGMGRCLALWAVAFVGAVPSVFLLAPWLGLHAAMYATVAVGVVLLVVGGLLALRADTANHSPTPEQVSAFNAARAARPIVCWPDDADGLGDALDRDAGRLADVVTLGARRPASSSVRGPEVVPGRAAVGGRR